MLKHASYYMSQIHCRDAFVMLVATAQEVEPASKTKPGDLATTGDAGESRSLHLEACVFCSQSVHVETRKLLCVVDSMP